MKVLKDEETRRYASLSWVSPPSGYLKVNFDGDMVIDRASGRVGFVVRDHYGRLIAAGGRSTPDLTAVGAKLRVAWEGILYARRVLGVDILCIEEDSTMVIAWIRGVDRYGDGHPLIRNTRRLDVLKFELLE
ncbi:uncharacterized protein LOC120112459 [Phoenix dactylifera]|uniref:Uncharacterized protein LOC120112459 n=1 Tax=Phoenix dactylifera TaxID=42345 RepID=A0A8B9AMP1_PHODC|nr:uncharacterized protein LOC120112459 [Phoenix dactylifera]